MSSGEYKSAAKVAAQKLQEDGKSAAVAYLGRWADSDKALHDIAGWADKYASDYEVSNKMNPSKVVEDKADALRDVADIARDMMDDNDNAADSHDAAAAEAEEAADKAENPKMRGKFRARAMGRRAAAQGHRARGAARGAPRGGRRGFGLARLHGLSGGYDPESLGARAARRGLSPMSGGIVQALQEHADHPDADQDLQLILSTLSALQGTDMNQGQLLQLIQAASDNDFGSFAAMAGAGSGPSPALALSGVGGSSSSGTPLDPLSAIVPGRMSVVLSASTLAAAATTFSISVTANSSFGGPYFLSFNDPSSVGYALSSVTINGTPVYVGPGNAVAFIASHRISASDARGLPIYIGNQFRDWSQYQSQCGCQGPWDVPITVGSTLVFTGTLTAALGAITPFGVQLHCSPVGSAAGISYGSGQQVQSSDLQRAFNLFRSIGRGGGRGVPVGLAGLIQKMG